MWKIIGVLLAACLFSACQSEEAREPEGTSDEIYEPISYGGVEDTERSGRIPTGKDSYFKRTAEKDFRNARYGETNRSHDNDFNNEDAMAVVEKIHEIKEVTMAQAYSTDDAMYIAVMINPTDRRDTDVTEKIKQKAGELTEKKLTIYTNNNNWDHMKDLNARLNAAEAPDSVKKRIREFFNRE